MYRSRLVTLATGKGLGSSTPLQVLVGYVTMLIGTHYYDYRISFSNGCYLGPKAIAKDAYPKLRPLMRRGLRTSFSYLTVSEGDSFLLSLHGTSN